jgi:hypothetical protein
MTHIPAFHGAENEDLSDYLRNVERACISGGVRAQEAWLSLLPDFLEGSALSWFDRQTSEVKGSWTTLTLALENEFHSNETYQKMMEALSTIRQQPNVSV